jgi:hypothetical protein
VKCERWRTERVTGNDKEIRILGQKVRETRGVRKEKAVERGRVRIGESEKKERESYKKRAYFL